LKDKRIAVWGLTFKPDLVAQLLREGAIVRAYDPKGADKVAEYNLCKGVVLAKSALEAVEDAEALVLATEWNEFQSVDFVQVRKKMHTPLLFDGRNLFDPVTMKELGFIYHGIGRALAR
jgi:UDPglucose 6-dehydrogenase